MAKHRWVGRSVVALAFAAAAATFGTARLARAAETAPRASAPTTVAAAEPSAAPQAYAVAGAGDRGTAGGDAAAQKPGRDARDQRARDVASGLHGDLARLESLKHQAARVGGGEAYKIDCVARRFEAARTMVNLGDAALANADAAARRNDGDEARYQLDRLQMLAEKMRAEIRDAHLCVEDDTSFIQTTHRQVEVSPSLPAADPAGPPAPSVWLPRR